MSKTAIIIPARYSSTRLQAKALIEVGGKPIIQWVYEKALKAKEADKVIIATDSELIFNNAKGFGADVRMTSENHQSGSDRIAEVAIGLEDCDYIINLQGDEPMIKAENIDAAILTLKNDKKADISTLIRKITDKVEVEDPNTVKCVTDNDFFAMYFSRSPIPYERNIGEADFYAHIGLYGYKKDVLLKLTKLAQTPIEKAESLEQLRALGNGFKIKCAVIDFQPIGIDTKEDLEKFKAAVKTEQNL